MDDFKKMDELEKQLKAALASEEAPAGFEARVMNAVEQSDASRARQGVARPHRWAWSRWVGMGQPLKWISAFAVTAVLVLIGVGWQHQQAMERIKQAHREAEEREAGQAAKAKLVLALRITSAKLTEIQQKVDEARRDN
jgi:hypothetical protein